MTKFAVKHHGGAWEPLYLTQTPVNPPNMGNLKAEDFQPGPMDDGLWARDDWRVLFACHREGRNNIVRGNSHKGQHQRSSRYRHFPL